TKKSLADTQHIAIATVQHVDLLVSWNFKHIVNYNKIRLYNSINIKYGYNILEIRSPRDLTDEK
ncbi:MAG: PIN domain protein, partial [FCB group bacterium]